MKHRWLFVLTSHRELGSTGKKTGCWLEELAAPYWQFVEAGYEVTLSSIAGGEAPIDPESMTGDWLSDEGRRFLADTSLRSLMANTPAVADIEDTGFSGLFMVGGAGAAWDYPNSAKLCALVEAFHARGALIAGVCHGILGVARAVDGNGEPLVKGRRITCVSNVEEGVAGLDKVVPVLPEEVMRKLRALYTAAPVLAVNVVHDGAFFTGQNPPSAKPLAKKIVEHLSRQPG